MEAIDGLGTKRAGRDMLLALRGGKPARGNKFHGLGRASSESISDGVPNMANEPDPALTGAAFDLASAGYKPMPDPEKKNDDEAIGSDSASLREAAGRRSGVPDEIVAREYIDGNGEPIAADEAITLDRAVRDYAGATAADRLVVENTTSKELAARVDAMRAEARANDPDAAELQGFEPPPDKTGKAEAEKAGSEKAESEPADPGGDRTADELDPEVEKVINHPQVRQAIEQRIGEAEKSRQSYVDGLAAATQIAQMSFLSQFPELAVAAPESLTGMVEQMSRQDPAKFARVEALIESTQQLFAHQRQEGRRQAEPAQQHFLEFARSEDARLGRPCSRANRRETQHAVTAEIFASAKASGVEPAELHRLLNSEPLMRNAVFQRMMYDAGKYRLMMKARDAVATKPVPPVQRPGMARTPSEREHADLRTLSARLSSSGDIKDAVALYKARKSSKR